MRAAALFLLFIAGSLFAAPDVTPQGPTVQTSPARAEIVLNGTWLFQPEAKPGETAPGNDWGSIDVPGSWFPQREWLPGVGAKGSSWKPIDASTATAWYQRSIQVPSEWAGKEVLIDFERISTDAVVYLDGKEVGKIGWPGGTVDLTTAAKPGQAQTLLLRVTATADAVALDYMGIAQNTAKKAELEARGIIHDVVLSSRPKGQAISGIFIQPSVRNKKIDLTVEWNSPLAQATQGEVVVKKWPEGTEAKRWPIELAAGATSQVALDWADPELWDYKKPNLYTLTVSAKGANVDDAYSERFGFREWRIEGRNLLLNEIPFRPQPVNLGSGWMTPPGFGNPRAMGAMLDVHLSRGMGLGWQWPEPFFQRGKFFYQSTLASVADEKGFPIFGNLYRMNEFVDDANFKYIWPQNSDRWKTLTTAEWRKHRNHPSIVGWILSGNLGPKEADQDPRKIGKVGWNSNEKNTAQLEVADFMKKLDPQRTMFFGAAAWVGDVYNAMTYLNFIPLQEREEWLSEWAEKGEKPYLAIEFGTPLQNSFMRGRNHFGASGETEPWLAEFSAIYLGPEAYHEGETYRRKVRSSYQSGRKFQSFNFEKAINNDPVYQSIEQLFIRNTWRSWRGLNAGWAGMLSWADDHNITAAPGDARTNLKEEFKPGMRGVFPQNAKTRQLATDYHDKTAFELKPAGEELLEQGQPTLAFIAGPATAVASKAHNFRSGQKVEKQIVLINDTRASAACKATWTAKVNGQPAGTGTLDETIAPATSSHFPISMELPSVSQPTEGEITLEATIGDAKSTDTFPFTVFPAEAKTSPLKTFVLIADPVGKTAKWLGSMGVDARPWDGKPAPGALLVVGARSLSSASPAAPKLPALEAFVAAGGRLLMMSQDAEWLRQNLGFRVTRHSTRRMWPLQKDHPLVTGIPVDSLRDWSGESLHQEARPEYNEKEVPIYGWRWGQQGVLAAAAIEKPHFSGWRPLFESEFDLQYAPLMQLDFGRGRITWCALDLEDQSASDPAAEKLSRNLLIYAANAPLSVRAAKTVYVGTPEGESFLKSLGLVFNTSPTFDPSAQLTIIGPGTKIVPQTLWSQVERGGRVLFLAEPTGGVDHFGVRTLLTRNFAGSTNPPALPEFAGIGAGDLHLKTDLDWRILEKGTLADVQIVADGMLAIRRLGKGAAIWMQVGPNLLQGDKKELPEYLRFNRWRQCRTISQILANLGGNFLADSRVFRPQISRISLAGPWQVQMTAPLPLTTYDKPHADPGISEAAKKIIATPNAKLAGTFDLPEWYPEFDKACGEAVWKREITLPDSWAGKVIQINVPAIKTYDTIYWNEQPVGSTSATTQKGSPWNLPRTYRVPAGVAKAGVNRIVIRQFATDKQGGIHGRGEDFYLKVISGEKSAAPLYHPDYREEFETGDEPYRYLRW